METVYWITIVVIVVAVVAIAAYYNRPQKEGFVPAKVDDESRKAIAQAFMDVLGRDPHEYEVLMYSQVLGSDAGYTGVVDKLKGSHEFKTLSTAPVVPTSATVIDTDVTRDDFERDDSEVQETFTEASSSKESNAEARIEIYKKIHQEFQKEGKKPTLDDLKLIEASLRKDPNFTVRQYILRQDTSVIDAIHRRVYGTPPPMDALPFLKAKLVHFKLDEKKLETFLTKMKAIEEEPEPRPVPEVKPPPQPEVKEVKELVQEVKDLVKEVQEIKEVREIQEVQEVSVEQEDLIEETNVPDSDPIGFNSPLLMNSCMAKNSYGALDSVFVDPLYQNLKAFQGEDSKILNYTKKNVLAEAAMHRNLSELRYNHKTNSYDHNMERQLEAGAAAPFDAHMNIPRRSTRFGTFLDDANNTKIGSILPPFLYKQTKA